MSVLRCASPMFLKHLECSACGLEHKSSRLQNLCRSCNKPLFAIVDLAAASRTLQRETLPTRDKSLWRYREVLPLPGDVEPVSLGEGGTPLLRAQKFGGDIDLWIKDESLNPTQSFKARGMSVAVSMAKYLGASKLAAPSAGNAGGAGLGREKAPTNVRGASRGLRTDRPRVRGGRKDRRRISRRAHGCLGPARSKSDRRFSNPQNPP